MAHERSAWESDHWRIELDGWCVGEHYYVDTFGDAEYVGEALGRSGESAGVFRSVDSEGVCVIVEAEDFRHNASYVVAMADHIDSASDALWGQSR